MKRLGIIILALVAIASPVVGAQEWMSRKDAKEAKKTAELQENLDLINGRCFNVDIQDITHAVTGSRLSMEADGFHPEVRFRQDAITFFVPYFTGNAPASGNYGNDRAAFYAAQTNPVPQQYPHTMLDWTCRYPDDYNVSVEGREIVVTFSTEMGGSETYFCTFRFSKKNCSFTIDCKSFTKTSYVGHLVPIE